jgi:hypothetical protein
VNRRGEESVLGIGKAQARACAERAALASGHAWLEPVKVERSVRFYYVTSNWRARGGAVRVKLAARTGEVISIQATPR